jgi:hypothetical protein
MKPGNSLPCTLNVVGLLRIVGSNKSYNNGSNILKKTLVRPEGKRYADGHLKYDFKLRRIHVSPILRRLGLSCFSVSKTTIIGILKCNPGRSASSSLHQYNETSNSILLTSQSPQDTKSFICFIILFRFGRVHQLCQN